MTPLLRSASCATLLASVAFTSPAHAQDAVQWRVEDGGNGHWYERVEQLCTWEIARLAAEARGGHLATVTSETEQAFITTLGAAEYWLGGFAPPNQGCGPSAWAWVSGEPMSYLGWASGEPGTCSHTCMAFAIWGGYTGRWNNDVCLREDVPGFMCEWSADCNTDGIVDFGQVLAGELDDADGDNIPDCCEQGMPCGCAADFNGDGSVSSADFAELLTAWGATDLPAQDLDRNGIVDANDLVLLLDAWGPCP